MTRARSLGYPLLSNPGVLITRQKGSAEFPATHFPAVTMRSMIVGLTLGLLRRKGSCRLTRGESQENAWTYTELKSNHTTMRVTQSIWLIRPLKPQTEMEDRLFGNADGCTVDRG